MMRIVIVVAATEAGVIGKNNALIWHLPDDLKRFKQLTLGKPIVMGRKTYDAIGKPLPGRHNIVITRQIIEIAGCTVVHSLEQALRAAGDVEECCIIGGAEIYRQALPLTQRIELTRVQASLDGDAYFPSLDPYAWRQVFREEHAADERHEYAFTFLTLEREQ